MNENDKALIQAWKKWSAGEHTKKRRYYEFYRDLVRCKPELEAVTMDDVLAILSEQEPLRPLPAPMAVEPKMARSRTSLLTNDNY